MKWWKKCKELTESLFYEGNRKERRKGIKQEEGGCPKLGGLWEIGKWFFFLVMFGQSLVEVNAASEQAQYIRGQMIGMQAVGGKQEEGKDRKEMQKKSRMVRCTLLNGSVWSTEKNYMRRCKGKCGIFWDRAQNEERRDGGAVQQRS